MDGKSKRVQISTGPGHQKHVSQEIIDIVKKFIMNAGKWLRIPI